MGELSSYTRPARCFEEVAAENKPLSVSLGMGGGRGTGPSPAPHHQLPPPTKAQRSRKIKREDKFELFRGGMGFGKNVRTNVPDLDKSESVDKGNARSDDRRGTLWLVSAGARPYRNSAPRRCSSETKQQCSCIKLANSADPKQLDKRKINVNEKKHTMEINTVQGKKTIDPKKLLFGFQR
jgi:hypothetical protein